MCELKQKAIYTAWSALNRKFSESLIWLFFLLFKCTFLNYGSMWQVSYLPIPLLGFFKGHNKIFMILIYSLVISL